MAVQLANYLIIIFNTALAVYVGVRAWHYRPARFFVAISLVLIMLRIAGQLRTAEFGPSTAYAALSVLTVMVGVISTLLVLMLAALFTPEWWQGARPVRWISAPYIVALVLLSLDLLFKTGIFVGEMSLQDTIYRAKPTVPGGVILLSLLSLGLLPGLGVLIVAFARRPRTRPAIVILMVTIIFSGIFGNLAAALRLGELSGIIEGLAIVGVLAYIVLRQRLFEPRSRAIDLALISMSDAVVVYNPQGSILYANPSAATLGMQHNALLWDALAALNIAPDDISEFQQHLQGSTEPICHVDISFGTPLRLLEVTQTLLYDRDNHIQGALWMAHDVTELERRTALLDQERKRLSQAVERLEQEKQQRTELAAAVRALSVPVIPVWEGTLVLPLIGAFDTQRLRDLTYVLLESVERSRAQQVLIDLTGVDLIDEQQVGLLLRSTRAVELLGAKVTLVGIRPELAQALVAQGSSLDTIQSAATLQEAIQPLIGR